MVFAIGLKRRKNDSSFPVGIRSPGNTPAGELFAVSLPLIAAEAIGRLLSVRHPGQTYVTAKACSISALPLALTSRLIWADERL